MVTGPMKPALGIRIARLGIGLLSYQLRCLTRDRRRHGLSPAPLGVWCYSKRLRGMWRTAWSSWMEEPS